MISPTMNFPSKEATTKELIHKLDKWYGAEDQYEVQQVWSERVHNFVTYFVVVLSGKRIDMIRCWGYDGKKLDISIDQQREVA